MRRATHRNGVTSSADDSLVKVIAKVMKQRAKFMQIDDDVTRERSESNDDVTRVSEQQRDKRWTYLDPLKVCIAQKCEGRRSDEQFYRCVKHRCLP